MRFIAVLLLLTAFFAVVSAQDPAPAETPPEVAAADAERDDFRAAASAQDPSEREKALTDFLEKYPETERSFAVRELIAVARAEQAAAAVEAGNNEDSLRLFSLAVSEAPEPVSEQLFAGVLAQIPNNLFFRGLRNEAYKIAGLMEQKVASDPKKLLGIASFYLAVEDSSAARRLAENAIELDPAIPAAYQTLGLSHRLEFDLEASERAYSRALELDPASMVTMRGLAEIKRAVGKPDEAVRLYDGVIAANPADAIAGTGRTLALLDAGRLSEAEPGLELQLQANPKNLVLLVGAAYWYAANGKPEKAVDYANKAVAVEPRYTWGYIALARGLMASGRPLEAERILLAAKKHGNFPTLDYELAAARLEAGFYRDAADALASSFSLADGELRTKLGGRIEKRSENFADLLAPERKAGIFQPASAYDPANAERLKRLLRFTNVLDAGAGPEIVTEAADSFVAGDDRMKVHRQIYAAARLLDKRIALPKVTEFARGAVDGVDESLLVTAPEAAVLAEELYESRRLAIARDSLIVVPDLPKQTLSRILRGRIEEIDGWAAFEQGDKDGALVHLKRALSIAPAESAWSRSVYWKLGTVLQSLGREREALDNYIESYRSGGVTEGRKIVIETLYQQIYGSLEGLEARLTAEAAPKTTTASLLLKPSENEQPAADAEANDKIDDGEAPAAQVKDGADEEAETGDPVNQAEDASGEAAPAKNEVSDTFLEDIEEANRREMAKIDLDAPLVKPSETARPDDPPPVSNADENAATEDDAGQAQPPIVEEGGNAEAAAGVDDKPEADVPEAAAPSPGTRPRIVPGGRDRLSGAAEVTACTVALSQDSATIAVGGSTGILAGLEGARGVYSLKGLSSSPEDIRVTVDRSYTELVGRAMFLITSVSSRTGVYSVTFESQCGKKEVQITVR